MTPDPLGWLDEALRMLDQEHLRRQLRHHDGPAGPWIELEAPDGPRRVLHLCSNGYLGLAADPRVIAAAQDAAHRFGAGPGASRLITGGTTLHRELEDELAQWKRREAAMLLSSGYMANLAAVTGLVGRGDTVVSDELNHASIVDACRLSRAEVRVYRHADAEHAGALLSDAPGRRLLITDGVFSMDGDLAPLPDLCDAAERHGAMVVVDDAHGSGVIGPDGRGTAAALGCEERVDLVMATMSKALGSTGGYLAGSTELITWLENTARPFVFDTALAAPAVGAAHEAVRILRSEPERRERVLQHARRLGAALSSAGFEVGAPDTPILPVVIGSNAAALAAMERLLAHDVLAVAIRPPTVAPGTARIRATVMATHTDADIDHAIAALRTTLTAVAA